MWQPMVYEVHGDMKILRNFACTLDHGIYPNRGWSLKGEIMLCWDFGRI